MASSLVLDKGYVTLRMCRELRLNPGMTRWFPYPRRFEGRAFEYSVDRGELSNSLVIATNMTAKLMEESAERLLPTSTQDYAMRRSLTSDVDKLQRGLKLHEQWMLQQVPPSESPLKGSPFGVTGVVHVTQQTN